MSLTKEKQRAYERKRRERFIAQGLCRCGRQRADGSTQCETCLQKRRDRWTMYKTMTLETGLCSVCRTNKVRKGTLYCPQCSFRASERYYARKEKGAMTY